MAYTRPPETTPAPPADTASSPWANKWTVLAAVLVALLVVAGAWIALTRPGAPAPAGPHRVSLPPPAAAPGCGPAGPSIQTPPVVAPATAWRLVGSMAAPSSVAAGPVTIDEGIGLCYSADPVGALFAAANFVAATTAPELRERVLDKAVAPGPGRDAALAATRGNPGPAGGGIQIAGYAFTSYTPARSATVDLALTSQGRLLHLPIELRFTDGDWKVVLPVTGRPFDNVAVIPSLAGYITWQGA